MIKKNFKKRIFSILLALLLVIMQECTMDIFFTKAEGFSLKDTQQVDTAPYEITPLDVNSQIIDISAGYKHYFKSDYYSAYDKSGYSAPQVQFTADGTDYWESSDKDIAVVAADIDPTTAIVTAGDSGKATITAKAGGEDGMVVGTADVYVPIVSEDFENSPDNGWSIESEGILGSASNNKYASGSHNVVSIPAAAGDDTHAFEFATGRGDGLSRCSQKKVSIC